VLKAKDSSMTFCQALKGKGIKKEIMCIFDRGLYNIKGDNGGV